jgi:hypothetical protein
MQQSGNLIVYEGGQTRGASLSPVTPGGPRSSLAME